MPERKAESVLELPAYSIFRSRTKIGDQLVIERYEAKKPSRIEGLLEEPAPPVIERQEAPVFPGPPPKMPAPAMPLPPQSSRGQSRPRFADTKTH